MLGFPLGRDINKTKSFLLHVFQKVMLKWEINLHFYFHASLWCLKMFIKVVKALTKPFEAPQKRLKRKIHVDFLSSSGVGMRRVTIYEVLDILFLTWSKHVLKHLPQIRTSAYNSFVSELTVEHKQLQMFHFLSLKN